MEMRKLHHHLDQARKIRGFLKNWTDAPDDIPYEPHLYGENAWRGRFTKRILRLRHHETEAAKILATAKPGVKIRTQKRPGPCPEWRANRSRQMKALNLARRGRKEWWIKEFEAGRK